ncbi:MAG: hypothetical protein A2857_03845 [Candidatus Levybacteria bacterium RIFCSPHIGHO2_01_FULL_36_15]|nr:MAG: hypothetical protein A2857_03845 [Candidatus Levybacteria bacterium RIFCSPHIGHO2_01_FULL_36_15]OGH38725.1 MAG: hypothetical protein A2905_03660 [Candidatus Levybacteria bacterium RIFCSPLOWO2_01_FULL_36_10]
MTATGHALVGALIAGKISNPLISVPLAFASHFVCDYIPHWDEGTYWRKKSRLRLFNETVVDVVISLTLSFVLYRNILLQSDYVSLYLCVFAAQFPDWIASMHLILGINNPIFIWVEKVQGGINRKLDKPWGIVTQACTVVLLYTVLYKIF